MPMYSPVFLMLPQPSCVVWYSTCLGLQRWSWYAAV